MIEVIYLGGVFCALLTVYVLLFKKDALRSYADYLLAIFFILEAWCVIMYLLIYSGWIVNVPHFYKTAAPFNFVLPVLSFLYVRSVLYNEKKVAIKDLWHFIPFILFMINYIPFFILPTETKVVIVNATTEDINQSYIYQAGIIPEYLSFIFRIIQTLVYLIFQWGLIIKYNKENKNSLVQKQIDAVIKWLKIFTWASTCFVIAFIVLTIIALIYNTLYVQEFLIFFPGLLLSSSFLLISSYLVTHSDILNGLPFIKYKEIVKNVLNQEITKIPFIEEDYTAEIEQLEQHLNKDKPYLNNNLTIGHLAVNLNLPLRELSYIINNYYKVKFTDLINTYRINYITNRLDEKFLTTFTIESLALEAGFNSKTSFYRAFKKEYNCTPKEYLEQFATNSVNN